jgi:putative transferase (TIGR04331 family)
MICLTTYNATTYLESLVWVIPTITFWNSKYWELREEVQPYFEKLEAVVILHETPESAASHMATVSDDVAGWF